MKARGSPHHVRATEIHALRRFRERIGIDLPRDQYARMVRAVVAGDAPFVALTPDNVRVFHVRYAGRSAYAVFGHDTQTIATFYPSLDWVTVRGGRVVREGVSA